MKKIKAISLKPYFVVSSCVFIVLALSSFKLGAFNAITSNKQANIPVNGLAQIETNLTKPSFKVAITRQSNSPVRIAILKINTEDPYSPEAQISVTNIGDQPIRAYTISYEAKVANTTFGGMFLTNIQENNLAPNQSRLETIGGLPKSREVINQLTLMVDYVEFTNDRSWGPDANQSAELLSGNRAGIKAEKEYLSELLESRGPDSVIETYNSEEDQLLPSEEHSQKWLEGFRSGKATVRFRLKHSIKKGTIDEIKSELQKIK
jgi:hypothetical protein